MESSHHFVPVAVETLGVFGSEARTLLRDLGRRLKDSTLEPRSHHYLLQRISVAVQRGNTAAILGSLASDSDLATPFFPTLSVFFIFYFFIILYDCCVTYSTLFYCILYYFNCIFVLLFKILTVYTVILCIFISCTVIQNYYNYTNKIYIYKNKNNNKK